MIDLIWSNKRILVAVRLFLSPHWTLRSWRFDASTSKQTSHPFFAFYNNKEIYLSFTKKGKLMGLLLLASLANDEISLLSHAFKFKERDKDAFTKSFSLRNYLP